MSAAQTFVLHLGTAGETSTRHDSHSFTQNSWGGHHGRVWAGLQAAERQACWTLWAHVLSSSVTECLSGSCSSLDVMVLWTFCRKLLVPAGGGGATLSFTGPRGEPPDPRPLTILVAVVSPVRALLGVVGRDSEQQRRDAREVSVI